MRARCPRAVAAIVVAVLAGGCAQVGGAKLTAQEVGARADKTNASTPSTVPPAKPPSHALAASDPVTYVQAAVDATFAARTAQLAGTLMMVDIPKPFSGGFDGATSLDGQQAVGGLDMTDAWRVVMPTLAALTTPARISGAAVYFDMPALQRPFGTQQIVPPRLLSRRWLAMDTRSLVGPSGLGPTPASLLYLLPIVHAAKGPVTAKADEFLPGVTDYSFAVREGDARAVVAAHAFAVPSVLRHMLLATLAATSGDTFQIQLDIGDDDGVVHRAVIDAPHGVVLGGQRMRVNVDLLLSHLGTAVNAVKPAPSDVELNAAMLALTRHAVGNR